MPDNIGILLNSMAGSLRQSNLAICQLVATALDGSVDQINTKTIKKSEIAPVKLDGIDPPPDPKLMDLFQAILQSAADLSWRRPGFGKIPDAIANQMAVCEIIGPTGQIKHETVRAGLLFQAPNITYPRHRHAAEEIYFPLTGSVDWQTGNAIWCQYEAGSFIHHLPYQPHAIRTGKIPLLTIWGWTGDIAAHSYRI